MIPLNAAGLDAMRADMAREHLAAGRPLRARAHGLSMWPCLRPGALVTVEPLGARPPRRGDVVLADFGGRLVLHRVLRVAGDRLWLKGDARPSGDPPVAAGAVLGRLAPRALDPVLARLSPLLGRPLALGAALTQRFFDRLPTRS